MTNPGWLFLPVGAGVELALASASVHRVLHSGSLDFAGYSHDAVDLAAFLGLPQDPALPQVVVVLNTGAAWRVGDAALQREGETLRFLALSPELLSDPPPWCRGVLSGDARWAYVVEESAVA